MTRTEHLRRQVRDHALSLGTLALSCGVSASHLSGVLAGHRPSEKLLRRLEKALPRPVWLYEKRGESRWTYDRRMAHDRRHANIRRAKWIREVVGDDGKLWELLPDHRAVNGDWKRGG